MPILVNLDQLLEKRQMHLSELSAKVGIPVSRLNMLREGKTYALRLATIDALCTTLACEPGELIQQVDEASYRKVFPDGPIYFIPDYYDDEEDDEDDDEQMKLNVRKKVLAVAGFARKAGSKIRGVFKK